MNFYRRNTSTPATPYEIREDTNNTYITTINVSGTGNVTGSVPFSYSAICKLSFYNHSNYMAKGSAIFRIWVG